MPKRRTELSPSPLASHGGAYTRSRSELFLHRTRSGLARLDPAPLRHHLLLRHLSATSPPHIHGGNLVKDLRLRRVFSPASVSVEEEASPDRTGKIGLGHDTVGEESGNGGIDEISKDSHRADGFYYCSIESFTLDSVVDVDSGTKSGDLKDGDKLDSIDPPKSGSSTPPELVIALNCSMKSRNSKDDAKLDPIDSPKSTKSTPPQCVAAVDLGMKNIDQLMKDSQSDIKDGVKLDPYNPSKKILGLAPCSRSKLVWNQSLFSYRRMLPFLMDLDKEENPPCENNNPAEVERVIQEKQLSPPENLVSEQPLQHSSLGVSLNEELCKSSDFVDNPSMNSCDGRCAEVSKIESEASLVDPVIKAQLLLKPVCSPPTIFEALSVQEMAGSVPSTPVVPKEGKMGCKNTVPTIDIDRRPIVTSKSDIVHSSERHLLSPKRGILKRHTRGCKGVCMCLDCVSFRLHADRAFEFSRKQMQEADETIAGLVKELASLRNLVEKSILPSVGSGSYGILQFTQHELIEGACRRASRAEEIASNRCRQMFNDLNSHCRIPGPRVTFADCIEERKIPYPETNNSKSLEKFTLYGSS